MCGRIKTRGVVSVSHEGVQLARKGYVVVRYQ